MGGSARGTSERRVIVSYETVRQWCRKFGPEYAGNLRRRRGRLGDTWYLGELFVSIQGNSGVPSIKTAM